MQLQWKRWRKAEKEKGRLERKKTGAKDYCFIEYSFGLNLFESDLFHLSRFEIDIFNAICTLMVIASGKN